MARLRVRVWPRNSLRIRGCEMPSWRVRCAGECPSATSAWGPASAGPAPLCARCLNCDARSRRAWTEPMRCGAGCLRARQPLNQVVHGHRAHSRGVGDGAVADPVKPEPKHVRSNGRRICPRVPSPVGDLPRPPPRLILMRVTLLGGRSIGRLARTAADRAPVLHAGIGAGYQLGVFDDGVGFVEPAAVRDQDRRSAFDTELASLGGGRRPGRQPVLGPRQDGNR